MSKANKFEDTDITDRSYEKQLIVSDKSKNNKVYLVENGKKRWIVSAGNFERMGYKWENIKTIPESIITKIPEGDHIGESIYDIRYRISSPFLSGIGIEIGAGIHPQHLPNGVLCEYFDIRNEKALVELFEEDILIKTCFVDQIPEHFPNLADFLIAHNVLEHCSNPINTLRKWHSFVKNGGIVVISVPCNEYCPDLGRNVSPFDHILFDFLFNRDDNSFESKEHIYSFIMGWVDEGVFKNKSKLEIAKLAHQCAHNEKNDLHWHVYTEEVLKKVIQFSGLISGKNILFESIATPYKTESAVKTDGEVVIVYRIFCEKSIAIDNSLKGEITKSKLLLEEAYKKICNVIK